jgi:hypothetical protein
MNILEENKMKKQKLKLKLRVSFEPNSSYELIETNIEVPAEGYDYYVLNLDGGSIRKMKLIEYICGMGISNEITVLACVTDESKNDYGMRPNIILEEFPTYLLFSTEKQAYDYYIERKRNENN